MVIKRVITGKLSPALLRLLAGSIAAIGLILVVGQLFLPSLSGAASPGIDGEGQPYPPIVPPPSVVPSLTPSEADPNAEVITRYEQWKQAWQDRNLEEFISFYAPKARVSTKPESLEQYAAEKSAKWKQEKSITITDHGKPVIRTEDSTVTLTVRQEYDSTTWWDIGIKTLVWRQFDGQWLIVAEHFKVQHERSKS